MKEELRISLVQADIVWEDIDANLEQFSRRLAAAELGDIVVLPEMFSTGFSTNARNLAEPFAGSKTLDTVRQWARQYSALFAGSFIAEENGCYYNRGFLCFDNGDVATYDKKHLFIGGEKEIFTPGSHRLLTEYEGWKLAFTICYDLRFPVWNRYTPEYDYDLMVCVAQWPTNRQDNFETLLKARAVENQCYLCACNRVGSDENYLHYSGGSQIIDFKGNVLCRCNDQSDEIVTFGIKKYPLESNREKFPVGLDADKFELL